MTGDDDRAYYLEEQLVGVRRELRDLADRVGDIERQLRDVRNDLDDLARR